MSFFTQITQNWFFYCIISNIAVAFLENVYGKGKYDTFIQAFPYVIIPIVIAQYGFFNAMKLSPSLSLILTGVTFTLINLGFRTINMYLIGQHVDYKVYIAVSLMICAVLVLKLKF